MIIFEQFEKKSMIIRLLILCVLLLVPSTTIHASKPPDSPIIYMDGQRMQFMVQPIIINGTTLVPLREIFERYDVKLDWKRTSRRVTATKANLDFTYIIGETTAYRNNQALHLSVPGQIVEGYTLVPLRLISETLGSIVQWHEQSRTISIASVNQYETSIQYGVNLRTAPSSDADSHVLRLLAKDEHIHVIREIDALWLEVLTKDNRIGFISAKPKYTSYTSPTLIQKQADALITYAESYMGTPYEFGASPNQTATFDCSSFVKHVYKHILDMDLPRVSYNQAGEGAEVEKDELRRGDLVFFGARGLEIGHVGIYAGNNQVLHTFSKDKGVHYSSFDEQLEERFDTARRLF